MIVAPSWVGDALLSHSLICRLAERLPTPAIDVLASPALQALFRRMPEVRQVIPHPFSHGRLDFAARRQLGKHLAGRYRTAYVLPNSWKSALVPFFASIARRVGYLGEARFGLLNDWRRLDEQALPRLIDRYAALADERDAPCSASVPLPRLISTPAQQVAARQALGLTPTGEPIVFCPGAEYGQAKRWPVEHFAALARLIASPAEPVWLLGGPNDVAGGQAIERAAAGCARNLCGRTTLEQAIDLIAGARAVVSNDSGLMHVAAALDRPLIALYGSSSPIYTPPLSARAHILSLSLACSPCFQRQCPLGHTHCLEKLTPERVAQALQALLEE